MVLKLNSLHIVNDDKKIDVDNESELNTKG